MMKLYMTTKQEYEDCILFYRLGDFYEMFFEDAQLVSKELELTLTGKSCGLEERAPMCGVPFHAVDTYIERLVDKGYKIAVCDQVEDPKQAKGLVKREVTRVVTPGTNISATSNEGQNRFICCVCRQKNTYGISFCDVSTGEFILTQTDSSDELLEEIQRLSPAEIISDESIFEFEDFIKDLKDRRRTLCTRLDDSYFNPRTSQKALLDHFKLSSLSGLGVSDYESGTVSAGALLSYLLDTQKNPLGHIISIKPYSTSNGMIIDHSTIRNLELLETLRDKKTRGSLIWVLDRTKTAMGARLLRSFVTKPLVDKARIDERLDAVSELTRDMITREEIREYLSPVYDLERLLARITYKTANPRDLIAFAGSLRYLGDIKSLLGGFDCALLNEIAGNIDPLTDIYDLITTAIDDDPPLALKEGGIIRDGYNTRVDEYRSVSTDTKQFLADIAEKERQKTGIKNLKINFNKVYGYYLEVTRSNLDLVPDHYIRKQTLTGSERFITPELKELEDKILSASERLSSLEYDLYREILGILEENAVRVKNTAEAIALLDVLQSFSVVAQSNRYCRPQICDENILEISGGRHPVIEKMSTDVLFVENDTYFDEEENRIALITGPNMAGKSTYMRQNALIVLMAQIGSFVPASAARIGICDRIFTRIGASDDLSSGQSTFMIEMNEVSNILRNATHKSLIILDEIGRGTSTYDGLSIAWAVVEYISKTPEICARTLFATHYHELISLEDYLPNVHNYNVSVREDNDSVIFLRKIVKGGADKSYGIQVANLAGVPDHVTRRARQILDAIISDRSSESYNIEDIKDIPAGTDAPSSASTSPSVTFEEFAVLDKLRGTDVDKITPLEAMNLLYELKKGL
ncbi:MAG: DNA mismatch repair protein MutS [Eubacterium sp.]|nr:DNA mismatch repair protein MutS [Eubacterium sp.]